MKQTNFPAAGQPESVSGNAPDQPKAFARGVDQATGGCATERGSGAATRGYYRSQAARDRKVSRRFWKRLDGRRQERHETNVWLRAMQLLANNPDAEAPFAPHSALRTPQS